MKELTSEVKQELLAPFQSAEVRVRTHPYVAAYITARVVMTRLDEALPWQWSFKLSGPGVIDANGVMHQDGVLLIRGADGVELEFHDRGSAPPDLARGQPKQAKHAVSDCFKRCAVHVGIGRYLYELQGVQGGRVPKASLEKALAAVGYHGAWDDRHHGAIGGIREADLEDEPESLEIGGRPESGRPESESAKHASRNGDHAGRDRGETTRGRVEIDANGHSEIQPDVRPDTVHSIKIDEEQRSRLTAAVERGGGNVHAPTFLGWLAKNTANHATSLDEVLTEDLDELVQKLEDLAAKRKA